MEMVSSFSITRLAIWIGLTVPEVKVKLRQRNQTTILTLAIPAFVTYTLVRLTAPQLHIGDFCHLVAANTVGTDFMVRHLCLGF